MKTGSYVYYYDKNGNTCPTIVEAVKGNKIKIENLNFKMVWVDKKNCVLQEEAV